MDARRPAPAAAAHEVALRAVQKPSAKPWRGGGGSAAPAPAPPKVYRVEPREFRELVQRLTGAAPSPPPPASRHHHQQQGMVALTQPMPVRPGSGDDARQLWFQMATMAGAGLDGQQQQAYHAGY